MTVGRISVVVPLILTIFVGTDEVSSGSVQLVGPKCGNLFDGGKGGDECGSTITLDADQNLNLGVLCKNSDRLKLGVVRNDIDIKVGNLVVNAYLSKIQECDEPDPAEIPPFMEIIQEDIAVNDDLTIDVSGIAFPGNEASCGNHKIVFVLTSSIDKQVFDRRSRPVKINCESNVADVKIELGNAAQGEVLNVPDVEVGDQNPFGYETSVKVSSGTCLNAQTMACLYCGFDGNSVGVDNQTWYQWQTMEGRLEWAKSVSSEPDSFTRMTRFGQCEMMHFTPLHQNLNDQNEDWLDLNKTFVPLPWAYDAMEDLYNGQDTNCGMMLTVDYLKQCPDDDRSNNLIVFPVILSVDNHTVESVREKVQLNWPDAETGITKEEQNKACTVLSNYVEKGKTAMMFPAPDSRKYTDKMGVVFSEGTFSPLDWKDSNFWTSLAALKSAMATEDKCPAQCAEKFKQTQNIVGQHDNFMNKIGRLINETDDVIQGLGSTEFETDLIKYKDVSNLVRQLFSIFSETPRTNRQMAKIMMKMMKFDDKEDQTRPRPKPRPLFKRGSGRIPYAKMKKGELCPSGAEITEVDDCRDAVGYAAVLGITLGNRKTLVGPGKWGHVPSGCSYQAGGDQAFHFNKKDSSNGLNDYRMICKEGKAMEIYRKKSSKINGRKGNALRNDNKSRNKNSNWEKGIRNKMDKKKIRDNDDDDESRKDKKSRRKGANRGKGRRNKKNKKGTDDDNQKIDSGEGKKSKGRANNRSKGKKNKKSGGKTGKRGNGKIGKCPLDKLSRSLSRMEKLSDRLEDDDLNSKSRKRIEAQLEELGPLSECLKDCEENVLLDQDCEDIDLDLKDGCNQMFSCSHACSMRHLGMGEEKCMHQCNRTGSSGCTEKISFYHQESDGDVECEFSLCEKCKRKGCESRYPRIEECEFGCKSYYNENENDDEDDETMDESGNFEPENEIELKYEDEDESDMDDEYESTEDDDEGDCEAYSEDACRSAGEKLGLEFGGGGYEFIGEYETKGCYAYTEESSDYGGRIYYGIGGERDDMKMDPSKDNQYRPLGYDCTGADEIDETDEDEISNETSFDDDDEEYSTDEVKDHDFDGNNDESSYYQEDDIEEDYPCGDTVSNDCEQEYENAKNNDDMDSFYGRCFEETGSDRFRERCSLCCEDKMEDDDESEVVDTFPLMEDDYEGCMEPLCTSCDISGKEEKIGTGMTLEECKLECLDDSNCQSIDFGKGKRDGECYFNYEEGASFGDHENFDAWSKKFKCDDKKDRQKRSLDATKKTSKRDSKAAVRGKSGKGAFTKNDRRGMSLKKKMGPKQFLEKMRKRQKGSNRKPRGFHDQLKNFFEDITRCDNKQRCGKNNFLQELSSCVCQSLWSRHSDPSGSLCQAIPKATRMKAVEVISMFMKGKGPQMPQNKTMIKELTKLSNMWQKTFDKLVMLPFEKEDWKMMITMENDNLTELLSKWKDTEGVEESELSAVSLYNQLVAESRVEGPVSESYSETATELIQMIQGMSHSNAKRCDRRGQIGDAPTQEEFCLAYRAQKFAEQLQCSQAEASTSLISGLRTNMKNRPCNNKNKETIMRDLPIIWRKQNGNIVKGSFCEMESEWYWTKVATCGRKGGQMERKKKRKDLRITMKDRRIMS